MTITEILTAIRAAHDQSGLSWIQVAKATGLHPAVVSGVLKGTRKAPSFETVVKLAGAYGLKFQFVNQPEREQGAKLKKMEIDLIFEEIGETHTNLYSTSKKSLGKRKERKILAYWARIGVAAIVKPYGVQVSGLHGNGLQSIHV